MNEAFEIANIGLAAQQKALDVIANNISNINTPAFKRSGVQFSELMSRTADAVNPLETPGQGAPTAGVTARAVLALGEQGEIERTGHELDIAIQGRGFLELMGPAGQTLLWRGGPLAVQSDGMLSAGEGLPLRAAISIPQGANEFRITSDGVITARIGADEDRVELGQLSLVQVADVAAIERLDGGFYRVTGGAGMLETTPGTDGAGSILQGSIERSNVEINDEMVRLMIVQRAYAANAQVIQAADQLAAIANSLRR